MKMMKRLLLVVCLMLCLVMTGCGGKKNGLDVNAMTCAEIAQLAQDAADFMELTDVNASYLDKYLWIDEADLDDWAMRRDATRATPEMILVLKVKEGADMAAIKQAVQDYHDEQILTYRDYQPAQMPKLESAKVMVNGRCIVLVVSPDAAKVNEALGGGWN